MIASASVAVSRSRIALVHNGSALFTGDAGQGESNIRRWVLENDWLEAIIALPLNIFYNTGIATYIWVLANRKAEHRRGKVQLIDASGWFQPLRRNLGKKNCELAEADIQRILDQATDASSNLVARILSVATYGLASGFVGPFYAAGGFALYLDRRAELEAWDIELALRKMKRRREAVRSDRESRA